MENLLPIGSVVSVGDEENGYVPVVIAGYGGQNDEKRVFDYIGFIFPFGYISRDKIIIFDSKRIHEVVQKGYEDEEYKDIISDIKNRIDQVKGGQ